MATKDEIYISVNPDKYKKNKANILASQADIINSIKHLRNLNQFIKQEKNLKIRLKELFDSVKENLKMLEGSIPTATIPKSVREKTLSAKPIEDFEETFETSEQTSEQIPVSEEQKQTSIVDLELQEIQNKLKQLNA
tara:strand:+ start:1023 stop:1433 length:411 start_codon:yes stop_codon:yes gene_type:complete